MSFPLCKMGSVVELTSPSSSETQASYAKTLEWGTQKRHVGLIALSLPGGMHNGNSQTCTVPDSEVSLADKRADGKLRAIQTLEVLPDGASVLHSVPGFQDPAFKGSPRAL